MESPQFLFQSALHAGPGADDDDDDDDNDDSDDGPGGEDDLGLAYLYILTGEDDDVQGLVYLAWRRTWKTLEVGAPKGPRM